MTIAFAENDVHRVWADFVGLAETHPAVDALADACQTRRLKRGQSLLKEADEDGSVFLIAVGTLRTVRHTEEGQEVWFTDAGAGEIIGEIAALTGLPRTSSVTAQSRAVVLAVERTTFLAIAGIHGEVGLAVARLLAFRLAATSSQVANLAALTVQSRLHRELLRLGIPGEAGRLSMRLDSPPSVTELGQRIHATREATSRALRDLEQRGLVARTSDAWLLLDPHADRARQ